MLIQAGEDGMALCQRHQAVIDIHVYNAFDSLVFKQFTMNQAVTASQDQDPFGYFTVDDDGNMCEPLVVQFLIIGCKLKISVENR